VETLYHLVKRGRASHIALAMLTVSEEAETNVTKVRICRLRSWLRSLGGEIEIRNERGWGYVLEQVTFGTKEKNEAGRSCGQPPG